LQEIQRTALGAHERARAAGHMTKRLASRNAVAFSHQPFHGNIRIHQVKAGIEPRLPTNDCRLPGDDPRARGATFRQQVGRHVTAAQVFLQCPADIALDR